MENNNLALAIAPKNTRELWDYANAIAKSGIYGQSEPDAVFTILATGIELGFSAVQSLRAIHVIKGKPTLSAAAMMALVRASDACEYFEIIETTDALCTCETKRKSGRNPTTLSFTMQDAKRAQLVGDGWRKYPSAMLRARAISALARLEYPEVLLGIYEEDEIAQPQEKLRSAVDNYGDGVRQNACRTTDELDIELVPDPNRDDGFRQVEKVESLDVDEDLLIAAISWRSHGDNDKIDILDQWVGNDQKRAEKVIAAYKSAMESIGRIKKAINTLSPEPVRSICYSGLEAALGCSVFESRDEEALKVWADRLEKDALEVVARFPESAEDREIDRIAKKE